MDEGCEERVEGCTGWEEGGTPAAHPKIALSLLCSRLEHRLLLFRRKILHVLRRFLWLFVQPSSLRARVFAQAVLPGRISTTRKGNQCARSSGLLSCFVVEELRWR